MPHPQTVEVINLGDELLVGIRENTHLQYLGEQLAQYGLPVKRARVISDDLAAIQDAFTAAWASADVVITTGGLGPTADDLTREAVATALGAELVYDASIEACNTRALCRPGATDGSAPP
jgi:nicotinamide-nucleotide amidase